jgi:hypothetical protein
MRPVSNTQREHKGRKPSLYSGKKYNKIIPYYLRYSFTLIAPKGSVTQLYINFNLGDLGVALWPLVPKFVGSNPAEVVGFLRAKKSSARLHSEGK